MMDGCAWLEHCFPVDDQARQDASDPSMAAVQDPDDDFLTDVAAFGQADRT